MDPFDQTVSRARARAGRLKAKFPRALDARFNPTTGRVEIDLSNRVQLSLDPREHQGLEHATAEELGEVQIQGMGTGVRFPRIDADLHVPGLLLGHTGSKAWMAAQLGASGGASTSAAKAAAARENGRKGGRPRKAAVAGDAPEAKAPPPREYA